MQINNHNPSYYNEYQNFYYLNPPQPYQINPQIISPYIPQSYMMQPKTLEESINMAYNRGIVNHLIGAFFIKECQGKQKNKETRKVRISTVELKDEQTKKKSLSKNKEDDKSENDSDKKDKDNEEEKKEEEGDHQKEKKEEEKEENDNDNELKIPSMV